MTTFYEALDNASSKIMESQNFGVSATYTVAETLVSTSISAIIHMPHNVPYQDLAERKITNDGYMWSVHCRKDAKVIFSEKGETANLALIQFLVSEVPSVVPRDIITINTVEWFVI